MNNNNNNIDTISDDEIIIVNKTYLSDEDNNDLTLYSSDEDNSVNYEDINNNYLKENVIMNEIILTDYESQNLKDEFLDEGKSLKVLNELKNNIIDVDNKLYIEVKKFLNNILVDILYYKIDYEDLNEFLEIEYKNTKDCINNKYDYIIFSVNNLFSMHIQYTYLYNTIIRFRVNILFPYVDFKKINEKIFRKHVHKFLTEYSNYYQYADKIYKKKKWWHFWKLCI